MSIPSGPMPASALAQLLHTEPPDRQRMLLGESLYPLVARSQPQLAGKITGMLLEIDQSEILHLIETPDALNSKIEEALQVSSSGRRLTLSLPPFFPFFFFVSRQNSHFHFNFPPPRSLSGVYRSLRKLSSNKLLVQLYLILTSSLFNK